MAGSVAGHATRVRRYTSPLMIRVTDLRKRFGALTAVDGVSFEVRRGETLGLLGPNGAGKTTTIHMIVGALRPDGGAVEIDGRADPSRPDVRARLGVAPQKLSLYEELSAEENLAFFGRLYGLNGARLRERVDWCLEFAGLTDRRRGHVGTFSGGMQRRLNLACGLIHDPPVLLLDEPTVGVDPQSRNHLFESIESLKKNGLTLIYTTHYMEEAERLCDRVAIMDHGRILALDAIENLIGRFGGKATVTVELMQPPADPSALPGTLEGLSLRIETDRPFDEVARLGQMGVGFATLKIDRPDLESVFLSLTGRRLRDE
ncbi:MAG: ABC transporter ATP-binding protein [Phycisphaerae bacterium]|nr:ABC transporter ATP-binding protein [Phycisphaerae bacterium]